MHRLRDDSGFTLTELIVAVGLLLVVLTMSYAGLQAIFVSRDVSDRQAVLGREVGTPLTYFEEILSQNLSLEAPGPYSARFLTDRNNDNVRERHIISANPDGTLVDQVWLVNNTGLNTSLVRTFTWSTNNANQATGKPLFRYYTGRTATSTAMEIVDMTQAADKTREVVVTIAVLYDGKSLQDSREILFRNR